MVLDYNLKEILENLDDSLFRLRHLDANGSKKLIIDSNSGEKGTSTTHKASNMSLQEHTALKESFELPLSSKIGIKRPFNDGSCMENFPVSCIIQIKVLCSINCRSLVSLKFLTYLF